VTVGEQHLTGKPGGVPWEEAGALVVAGTTAYAADRIRRAASKVDAFIDTFGAGYVQLALELGVEPSRINTIVNFGAVAWYGVSAEGNEAASTASVLAELAGLIAAGELELPIAATFPLDQVQDAYRRLAQGHVLGKIVLLP